MPIDNDRRSRLGYASDTYPLVEGLEVAHPVRVVTVEGKPWFAAADILRVLGSYLKKDGKVAVTMALKALDEADKGSNRIGTPSGQQTMATVSEAGLNILLMRSDKAVARPFQDWLAREVLPSIRTTGGYRLGAGETMPLPTSFVDALRQHAATLIKLAEAEEAAPRTEAARLVALEAKAQAEAELSRVAPLVELGGMVGSHKRTLAA